MNDKSKKYIQRIIDQLEEDKKGIQKQLNNNLDKISEINVDLKTLIDEENNDIDIFSPRNNLIVCKEQITKYNEEKNILEEKSKEYYDKLNDISDLLDKLHGFMSDNYKYKVVRKNTLYSSFALLEADRQRIAKDLHDTSLQNLTAIVHKVELASMYIDHDPVRTKLELSTLSKSLKETINEIRDTIFELRPMTFDDFGFKELIENSLIKEVENTDIKIVYDKFNISIKDQSILLFIYRAIKECVGNSVKHSKCTEIHLTIDDSNNNKLYIELSDNGIGFDIEDKNLEKGKHFGLIILKERVKLLQGNIEIISDDNGTKLIISVPINDIQ